MTMISQWMKKESPDRTEAAGFYIPGATSWAARTPATVQDDDSCSAAELSGGADVEIEDEYETISQIVWADNM